MLRTCQKCSYANPSARGGAAETCPECSTAYDPTTFVFAQRSASSGDGVAPANPATVATARQKITSVIAVVILAAGLLAMWTHESKPPVFGEAAAFGLCRDAIRAVAKDPDRAEIPVVGNASSGGAEFYFAWGVSTQHLRLRNGLGLEVPASGSCIVNASTKTVTSLTLNGKTVIGI